MNVGGRKVRMSPEAWAQCEFQSFVMEVNGGCVRLSRSVRVSVSFLERFVTWLSVSG